MTGIVSLIKSIFPKKAQVKTTEEVAINIAKQIPRVKKYLKPSETLAFSQKTLKRDGFYKIADQIYKTDRMVADLKSVSAPEALIKHTKAQYPLKLENFSLKWNTQKLENRITSKRNDAQIEKLLKNKVKLEKEHEHTLNMLKNRVISFEDTKITDADEILQLIKSGKYPESEDKMIEKLATTGNASHAKEIFPQINELTYKLGKASENGMERSNLKYSIATRIKTVGLIGDENTQTELISQLTTILKSSHDKDVTQAIFRGLGNIGKSSPNNGKYSEILLDELFTHNKKAVYEHLANFDGQFHIVAKAMIENPTDRDLLVSAYRSVRSANQKQIFAKEVLNSEELTFSAICSSSKLVNIDEHKSFIADVLSEIKAHKFDTLTAFERSNLNDTLGLK